MLGLNLRKEFQSPRLRGTAIELANENNTGATQVSAAEFFDITYPSSDLLNALAHIAKEVRHIFSERADAVRKFRVIVLPKSWGTNRWP